MEGSEYAHDLAPMKRGDGDYVTLGWSEWLTVSRTNGERY